MTRIFSLFARCTPCALLCACMVGPDYRAPEFAFPVEWNTALPSGVVQPATTAARAPWWQAMRDPTLNRLMLRALAANENRKIAQARILEARGQRRAVGASLYPSVDGNVQASRSNQGVPTFNGELSLFQSAFDARYELDLFGGNQRAVEAEDASLSASEADYHAITITLTAEVASEYVNFRELQHQRALAKKTLAAQEALLRISADKFKAGLTGVLDRDEAATLAATTRARLPELNRQLAATGNRLAVLLGEVPGKLTAELDTPRALPDATPLPVLNAPGEVIRQRPDIIRAERALAATTALQGVAISALYPKISISALFGFQYADLPIMAFTTHDHIWSLGGAIAFPILEFGAIEGQIDAADARQQQAFHAYRQTVLSALGDVETTFSNLSHENERRNTLEQAVNTATHAVDVARNNYREGLSDFTAVLQAEQQAYATQRDLLTSEATVVQYVIALNKAVGSAADLPPESISPKTE